MRRIFALSLSVLLVASSCVGCENDAPQRGNDIKSEIVLENSAITIEGTTSSQVVYFAIDNPAEGCVVTPQCDVDWVTDLDVVASIVKFSVAENSSRTPRQATIVLNYGEASASITLVQRELTRRFDVFPMRSTSDIPYRIPAIAVTNDGTILATADYRHSREDIGVVYNGRIDLHLRRSADNGVTWGDIETIVEGQGAASPDFMHVGFGDPCIVADRESSRVLVMCCAGNVRYQAGTRNNHQCIARIYSEDGGYTWGEPEDIAESIYSKFDDCSFGPVNAMFVASGRIMQSRTVKVGDYYRLYCAVIMRDKNSSPKNFVLYSDDFGARWEVLGGVDVAPIAGECDEPKVEELPDGSVLLSSRWHGGRYYNIYRFNDAKTADGSWGSASFSGASNDGVAARDNSTNGEVLLIPAQRVEDGAEVDLLLQSVPLGPGRKNVGIYFKALDDATDYAASADIASDWEGVYQVTKLDSSYSTMIWQADGRLGFLWEETTYCSGGGGFTIAYDCFSLEKLTSGKYRY